MLKRNKTYYLIFSLQILLGVVFIFSGISKLLDLNSFTAALISFNLFNDNFISIVKYTIPIIEIVLGISIIFNLNSSMPAFISSLLLSLFTALIVVKLFEGEDISCGCFGALSSSKLDVISVIRNVFLILVAIIISNYFENKKNVRTQLKSNKKSNLQFVKIIFISNIIFFLATQNLIFALQNNGLKSRLALLTNDYDILKKDDIVNDFTLKTLNNKSIYVSYFSEPKKTLIFLLKPTCAPCKLNLSNWSNLINQIDSLHTRIFPISIDDIENTLNYTKENKIPFPVYSNLSDDFLLNYKAFLTPQTILISNDGKVLSVWKGILTEDSISEILNEINNK